MDHGQWASGRWQVQEGKVDEFIKRWNEWLGWTGDHVAGFRWAKLLRSEDDPLRFTAFSLGDDDGSVRAWKTSEEFAQKIGACTQLCDEFVGGDFDEVVTVSPPTASRT
jgi:heme-degrading monooxygenase HmoA